MSGTVDVIIPYSSTHTPKRLLERAQDSVDRQTVDANIILVEDVEQRGPAWARNQGLEQSDNRYVAFLDADDYWDEEKLERQLDQMQRGNEYGLCLTQTQDIGEDHLNTPAASDQQSFALDVFLSQITSITSSICIDTQQTDARFDEDLYRREDHLFLLQTLSDTEVCFVQEPLVYIDKHDGGLSSTEDKERKLHAHHDFYAKAVDLHPNLERYSREFWQENYHRLGRQYYYSGNYRRSVELLVKSLRYKPTIKTAGACGISLLHLVKPS